MADEVNMGRREFLKELGLLGVAMGAVPAASSLRPNEAAGESWDAAPQAWKRPFWAKEVDKPTMEVDWQQMQRYKEHQTVRRGFNLYVSEEETDRLTIQQDENLARWLKESKPGYSLRDIAISSAQDYQRNLIPMSFVGPTEDVATPEERGVPKWEGTPEEAAMIISAAMRHFGAAHVGFVELETDTTEKLIYGEDPDKKKIIISEEHDYPEETDEARYLPKSGRWVISYTVQMSQETMFRNPTELGSQTTAMTYEKGRAIQNKTQAFLRSLGYWGAGEAQTNALGIAPAFAVMAGLGEIGRINRLVTPEYGPMVRTFKMVTNLPVAPTKPIDAGIMDFCRQCKVCAEYCPSGALSTATEPTWEVAGGWNNPGHKTWFEDAVKCRVYWRHVGTNCGLCFAACPYAAKDKAKIHDLVKATIGTTTVFNSLMAQMGRFAYLDTAPYSATAEPQPLKDADEWWTLDLPEYGVDTTRGHSQA